MYKINFFYVAPPALFDFEESFESWPGPFVFSETTLSSPEFTETFPPSGEGWPVLYEFNSTILSAPEINESFESLEGWNIV